MWLATLGNERIDEIFDPEKAINRDIAKKERLQGLEDNKKVAKRGENI